MALPSNQIILRRYIWKFLFHIREYFTFRVKSKLLCGKYGRFCRESQRDFFYSPTSYRVIGEKISYSLGTRGARRENFLLAGARSRSRRDICLLPVAENWASLARSSNHICCTANNTYKSSHI